VAKKLTVDGATPQLIEIQAASGRADEAQALSQAVAKAYVKVVTANARSVTGATLGELRARETLLQQQLKALQNQIDATNRRKGAEDARSPDGRRDAQLLAQLTVEQADASLQWDQVKKELSAGTAAGLASPAVIVQPATAATGPGPLSYFVTSALAGALLLAVLGAVVLLIRVRRDPRPRTRDDLADAVGSTVLADVRSRPQRSVAAWSALFQTYEAPAVDAWAFRQVLRALATPPDGRGVGRLSAKRPPGRLEHPRSVTIVSFAGDARGLAVGPQLASFAASLGIVTRFVAAGGHTSAPSLWAACSSDGASHLRAGLVMSAGNEDRDLDTYEGTLPPPPETLDELLKGLLVGGSHDDPDDAEIDSDAGEARTPARTPDPVQDDAGSGRPAESHDEDAEDAEDEQGVEPDAVPESAPTTQAITPEPMVQAVPRHVLTDLTVVLAVADRRAPTFRRLPSTAVTVLAISPGSASPEELARLAVAMDDSGRRIDGIIIADPDPVDTTTGRRTLNERALQPPLPVRTTGVSQLPLAGDARGRSR
jgi:hypothetical protein